MRESIELFWVVVEVIHYYQPNMTSFSWWLLIGHHTDSL